MFILRVFLLTILLTAQYVNPDDAIKPYDLEDEVRAQVEALRLIIRGTVFAAFTEIDNFIRDVFYYRNDCLTNAEVAIQQEHQSLNERMTTMKDLAEAGGHNVDVCVESSEPLLTQLPQIIIDSLLECLVFANVEVTIIQNEARYRIDILINEVNIFDYQIDVCAGNFLCMEPIVTQIILAEAEIPQKIALEVQRASDLSATLKLSIKQCTDDKLSQFVAEGGIIVANFETCVNNILS